jgi:hypothetical protein
MVWRGQGSGVGVQGSRGHALAQWAAARKQGKRRQACPSSEQQGSGEAEGLAGRGRPQSAMFPFIAPAAGWLAQLGAYAALCAVHGGFGAGESHAHASIHASPRLVP